MNRTSTIFCIVVITSAIISLANSSGAPTSRTGAPGESTCGASGCHGVSANQESATLNLDFQEGATAYQAGETYRVKVSISSPQNAGKNGFEIVALDANNENIGAWILALPDETQIKTNNGNNREYVTHTRNGNVKDNFEMDWKAPDEDAGPITFYVAFLDANGNGSSSGDHLYTTDLAVSFDTPSNTQFIANEEIKVFPNPAQDVLYIESSNAIIQQYQLFNATGQLVRSGAYEAALNLASFEDGLYFLRLETKEGIINRKVMLAH